MYIYIYIYIYIKYFSDLLNDQQIYINGLIFCVEQMYLHKHDMVFEESDANAI